MQTFKLVRKVDVSGVSGTGDVAEGVVFHDGQCILSWFGQVHSIVVYPCLADLIKIHGHEGATEVRFDNVPARPVRECDCDACEIIRDAYEVPEEDD